MHWSSELEILDDNYVYSRGFMNLWFINTLTIKYNTYIIHCLTRKYDQMPLGPGVCKWSNSWSLVRDMWDKICENDGVGCKKLPLKEKVLTGLMG